MPTLTPVETTSLPCDDLPAGYTEDEFLSLLDSDSSYAAELLRLPKTAMPWSLVKHNSVQKDRDAFQKNVAYVLCGCHITEDNRFLFGDLRRALPSLFHIGVGLSYDEDTYKDEQRFEPDALGDSHHDLCSDVYRTGHPHYYDSDTFCISYLDDAWKEKLQSCFGYAVNQPDGTARLVDGSLQVVDPTKLLKCFYEFVEENNSYLNDEPDYEGNQWISSCCLSTRWSFDERTLDEYDAVTIVYKLNLL